MLTMRFVQLSAFSLTLIHAILFPAGSWAQTTGDGTTPTNVIVVQSVVGASRAEIEVGTTRFIYAGLAGTCTGNAINADLTCNSCTASRQVCNTRRINPTDGYLHINFTPPANMAGSGPVLFARSDGSTVIPMLPAGTSNNASAGGQAEGRALWSQVCGILFENASNCNIPEGETRTGQLYVGIDLNNNNQLDGSDPRVQLTVKLVNPNSTRATIDHCESTTAPTQGICDFTAYPGDRKVYLEDIGNATGFPFGDGVQFKFLRLLYSTESFEDVTPLSPHQDFEIVENAAQYELMNNSMGGLENLTKYYFRVATVDEALNISHITSNAAINHYCSNINDPDPLCRFTAVPDEVLGMLTDDLNCFIATAAFGSSLLPQVELFRQFRNRFLLTHTWGKQFVIQYYKLGPYAARWVVQSEWRKAAARFVLWPLLALVWLSLSLPLWSLSLLGSLCLLGLIFLGYNLGRKDSLHKQHLET